MSLSSDGTLEVGVGVQPQFQAVSLRAGTAGTGVGLLDHAGTQTWNIYVNANGTNGLQFSKPT